MSKVKCKVAVVCKLMPLYRAGVFKQLSRISNIEYTFFGDTQIQGGIRTIPWDYACMPVEKGGIRWIFTKAWFYKSERQLWQSKIVRNILSDKYEAFIFEGAVLHLSTWVFAILCRLKNQKVIFWTHGFKGTDRGIKKLIRTLYFKYLPDSLLLYGNYSNKIMIDSGFPEKKLFTIGNSLNYYEQEIIRNYYFENKHIIKEEKDKLFPNNYKTIIFIGRIVKGKQIDKLIDAIYSLAKKNINLNCIIVGDGPEKANLLIQINSYNIMNQFHFTGELYDEKEIAKYFLISDLMVSPGNVGLNCMHAMAYGIPVLTHDNFSHQNPEVEAIIPGKNGVFFEFGNYVDMVAKIESWFEELNHDSSKYCIEQIAKYYNPMTHAKLINYAIMKTLEI